MADLDLTSLTAEFMQKFAVAALPSGQHNGSLAFAIDGRRSGEGAGNGTGLPCWYDEANTRWSTMYDNSAVAA